MSTAGYALGYVGGGLLLALNLAWILAPARWGLSGTLAATRLSFLSVAVWWAVFSVPLFRTVPEPPAAPVVQALARAADQVWSTSVLSLKLLGKMLVGQASLKNLSGPLTIADYAGRSVALGRTDSSITSDFESTTARVSTFSSSRTLPDQSCFWISSMACSLTLKTLNEFTD